MLEIEYSAYIYFGVRWKFHDFSVCFYNVQASVHRVVICIERIEQVAKAVSYIALHYSIKYSRDKYWKM